MSSSSQKVVTRQRNPQRVVETDQFDEYVYYPYHEKVVPGGGYEYVPDLQEVDEVEEVEEVVEYEKPRVEYVRERAPRQAPVQKTGETGVRPRGSRRRCFSYAITDECLGESERRRIRSGKELFYPESFPIGKMSEEPVKTYTIGSRALPSNAYSIHSVQVPPNGTDIQIIITEPTVVENDTSPRLRHVKSDPTVKNVVIQGKSPNAIPASSTVPHSSVTNRTIMEGSFASDDGIVQHEPPEYLDTDRDRVRVIVRVRPMNDREYKDPKQPQKVLHCINEKSIVIDGGQHNRRFTFDSVFDEASSQDEVFLYCGIKRLVDMAIEGYVATCFAYGQTGSGKTHTMIGALGAKIFRMDDEYRAQNLGIVPRSINYLFRRLQDKTIETSSPYYIRVSYCEIYNEQIRDLIRPANPDMLQVRGSVEEGFYVENLYQTYIETMDELLTILEEGELNRAMASHKLNETSSRSHAMLCIQIEQDIQETSESSEQMTRQGKLIFVDLAGSEKIKVSHSKGQQLVETNNINKSLLTLGTCISALSDPNKRVGHVPYRESKLTRLLSDSLGGHGITLMIACVSPARICENESLNSLRYANRAKNIENAPIVKTDSKQNVITRLKMEVRKLKGENYELRKQIGGNGSGSLPRLRGRNNDSAGSQTSIRSTASSDLYDRQDTQGRMNGASTQKIRSHHETLTRENQKLVRQLHQRDGHQGQSNGRRVVVVEEEDEPEEEEVHPSSNRQVVRTYAKEPDDELQELVRRPSYLTRYRTVRNRNGDAPSPQRRTTTIVRRAT